MPRFPRNYLNTSYFHVITQGINKSYIFEKSEDIKYYIKAMYSLTKEQKVKIISYCIMNNHAHILLQTDNLIELSKYMQRLNIRYGKYYNKKYQRVGYVFRDRFKSEGIYSEEHLYNCIKYIYNNPVKAGICNKAEEYQYSNYKHINKETNRNYIFMEIDETTEEIYNNIIKCFLRENHIELNGLKKDNLLLNELIVKLKKHNISLRKIAKETNINREKIRKLYNKLK